MKLDVIKLDGGKGGSVDLPDDIFGIEEIRADILQRVVTWQLAKRRRCPFAGTSSCRCARFPHGPWPCGYPTAAWQAAS